MPSPRTSFLVALLGGAIACTTSTGPTSLTGVWLVAQTWSSDSVSCSFAGESLVVIQTDTLLIGQVRGGTGSCVNYGVQSGPLGEATDSISFGVVKGLALSFKVTPQLAYEGRLNGSQISGTLTGAVFFGPPANKVVSLTGSWSGVKP